MDIELKQIDGKIIQIYPDEFKRKVIDEYLGTGVPKMDLVRKYEDTVWTSQIVNFNFVFFLLLPVPLFPQAIDQDPFYCNNFHLKKLLECFQGY